jgi:hypothetical protein
MALKTRERVINDLDVTPKVGSYLIPDGPRHHAYAIGELLLPGEDYVDSGFAGCQFRYPNPVFGASRAIAINLEITGRTIQYRDGGRYVRVKIEWVGDCEPSTFTRGWLRV